MKTGKAVKAALALGDDIIAASLLNDLEPDERSFLFSGTPDRNQKDGAANLFTAADKQRLRDGARTIAERGYTVWDEYVGTEQLIHDPDQPLEPVNHVKMK